MPPPSDDSTQVRLTEANYADGLSEPVAGTDPAAISSLFDQDGDMANSAGLSNLFVAWGQFLDHDLTLSPENEDDPLGESTGGHTFLRSEATTDADGVRTPVNSITWQIDGSQIYGSDPETTDLLRSGEDGHLRMGEDQWSDFGLLPDDHDDLMAGGGKCPFLAGDVRANENPALNSLHTLFAREHNYWADRLAEEHPDWTDDQLFDGARQIVEYELQKITYEEWLPKLIGDAVGEDTGYDADVNGEVSVEFSTAAFRFGHTMVSSEIPTMNEDGSTGEMGDMSIQDVFFDADPLRTGGIDDILRGQTSSTAQELDTKVVDDLNFALFNEDGEDGQSLVALNILRGQDHGLQSYVDTRAALLGDIDPATLDPYDFSIITSDPAVQAELASVYETVHDVDLWVGGLAEDAVGDTQMGPLFTYIIAEQFGRTRAGDETFGALDPALGDVILQEVEDSTLSDIIMRNTEIDLMQDDPFLAITRELTVMGDVDGTDGNDTLDMVACDIAGAINTGIGHDFVSLTGGTRVSDGIHLGAGHDTLEMSSGTVSGTITGSNGNDSITLSGSAHADEIRTGNDHDDVTVTQSASAGLIDTGNGRDSVTIGSRATVDKVSTGNDNDIITVEHGANVGLIDGGNNFDTLQIKGGPYRIDWKDGNVDGGDGRIVFLNADGAETGEFIDFCAIETVTCFTPGTRIITSKGLRPIETLSPGDLVYTLDNGLQPIVWVGKTTVLARGKHAPVRIAAQALGNSRTMEVSPQHRMLLDDWRAAMICGADEVLAPAIHLTNDHSITRRVGGTVDYIHLLFDTHQIIMADGIPSESFHPGSVGLGAMPEATRAEILTLFPALAEDLDAFGPAARYSATRREARMIQALDTPPPACPAHGKPRSKCPFGHG